MFGLCWKRSPGKMCCWTQAIWFKMRRWMCRNEWMVQAVHSSSVLKPEQPKHNISKCPWWNKIWDFIPSAKSQWLTLVTSITSKTDCRDYIRKHGSRFSHDNTRKHACNCYRIQARINLHCVFQLCVQHFDGASPTTVFRRGTFLPPLKAFTILELWKEWLGNTFL